jgi:hypothetical protein
MLRDMSYPSYSQINRRNNISPTSFQNFNIFQKGEIIKKEMKSVE